MAGLESHVISAVAVEEKRSVFRNPFFAQLSMLNPSVCHRLMHLAQDTTGLKVQISTHKWKIELQQCDLFCIIKVIKGKGGVCCKAPFSKAFFAYEIYFAAGGLQPSCRLMLHTSAREKCGLKRSKTGKLDGTSNINLLLHFLFAKVETVEATNGNFPLLESDTQQLIDRLRGFPAAPRGVMQTIHSSIIALQTIKTQINKVRKSEEAAQHDGVQLGNNHERGEQHRRRQRAHDALLLQTVWDSVGNDPVVLLFLDDPQVVHVPGPHSQQHQTKDLCWISMIGLMLGTCIAFYVVIADLGSNFFAQLLGDRQFPRVAADRCVSVHRAPSESAEEHDVLHSVLLRYGAHFLHLLHVHDSVVVSALRHNLRLLGGAGSPVALQGCHSVPAYYRHNLLLSPMVLSSFKHGLLSGWWLGQVKVVRWEGVFRCLPICGMAFACQSQVLPTYDSLEEPSVKRMSTIFTSALNVVTIFYITVGFFGYVSFTENIAGNVLMNFPSNLVTEMIRVGFMMSVAVGFPMMILPCRQAINTMLFEQQLVLFVGLGILLVSTFTTLSISARSPGVKVQAPPPPAPDKNNLPLPDLPKMHEKPSNKKSVEIEKPDVPAVEVVEPVKREPAEPPQIIGPVELPERKKEEEVQLDRPDAGVALPEGEAHRHEPPIPHDEVKVDTRKNKEVKIEPVAPAGGGEEEPNRGEEHAVEVEDKKEAKDEKKLKPEAVVKKEEVDFGGGEILSNEVLEKLVGEVDKKQDFPPLKEAEKLDPLKDAGNAAAAAANQAAVEQVEKVGKAADSAGKREYLLLFLCNSIPSQKKCNTDHLVIFGDLSAPPHEGEHHPAADEAPAADSKGVADEKMDEGQLDHAVLLQVIKEQQKQQKRLLDQQEKLLAVIEEQHKEIHQKQPAGAAPEGEEHLEVMEGGAAKPKDSGLAPDMKQPKEAAGAGAPQAGVAEPHAVAQNQVQAGDKGADVGDAKVAAPAAYKEDDPANPVAPRGESHKQSELGARGVPLGKKQSDDHQPVPEDDRIAQLKNEESNLEKEEEKIKNLQKEIIEKEVQARLEEQLEKERQLAREQELEKEREKEKIEKEVQARVKKERLERERREKLAQEQEQEKEAKEKLAQEKAKERQQIEQMQKVDNEIFVRARKEEKAEEKLAQLQQAENAAQGAQREDGEALKKGGRDLKVNVGAPVDPREGVDHGAIKAEAHPPGSQEKTRDQGDLDLKRRRRAVGPREDGGPQEKPGVSRGMPGLEPLLELGGSDLHVALEEQLLAGAMVHSRQIKQASVDKEEK
ncbi:hypothetical protein PAMP_010517 [Pampus punctatissimus]